MNILVNYINEEYELNIFKGRLLNLKRCECVNIGEDDGDVTCMIHHDCSDGSCTHTDGDDY